LADWLTLGEVLPFLSEDTARTDDPMLQLILAATCQAVEDYIERPVVARELTETFDGGVPKLFLKPRIWAVAQVTESGSALVAGDYTVYPAEGFLVRGSGVRPGRWCLGMQNITVTYTGGLAESADEVPATVKLAAMIAMKFYVKNGPTDYGSRFGEGVMIRPDSFPRQALRLLDKSRAG
jgi:hypothetical protein